MVPDDCWEELCGVHVGDVGGGGDAELAHEHQDGEDHTLLHQPHVQKGSGLRFLNAYIKAKHFCSLTQVTGTVIKMAEGDIR